MIIPFFCNNKYCLLWLIGDHPPAWGGSRRFLRPIHDKYRIIARVEDENAPFKMTYETQKKVRGATSHFLFRYVTVPKKLSADFLRIFYIKTTARNAYVVTASITSLQCELDSEVIIGSMISTSLQFNCPHDQEYFYLCTRPRVSWKKGSCATQANQDTTQMKEAKRRLKQRCEADLKQSVRDLWVDGARREGCISLPPTMFASPSPPRHIGFLFLLLYHPRHVSIFALGLFTSSLFCNHQL